MRDYSHSVNDLFSDQMREWDLARDNYRQLDYVRIRKVSFAHYDVAVQFNPARITSSAAKVDARSIESRPCFLCPGNRPPQQRAVDYEGKYFILINPFPIFKRHLTIVSVSHVSQRIRGNFITMLEMAKALPEFVIFYNGPECGASAPDHLHFQAGNKGFMPVENDLLNKNLCRMAAADHNTELWLWHEYGRGIITLKGTDKEALTSAFGNLYGRFALSQPERDEPMLNILASHSGERWIVHVIPRRLHRPSYYFAEGRDRILISPASVDIGGVLITPREEDFVRITNAYISDIFRQVCLSEEEISSLTADILCQVKKRRRSVSG
jgi:hypothetical protein